MEGDDVSSPDVNRCDLLLIGGAVVTVDDERQVFDPGAIAVTGDRIVAVGPAQDFTGWEAERRIDTTGMAVLPGFSDTHQHLFQYLMRGLGEGIELWPWLEGFIWPLSDVIRPADAIIGAKLAAIEAAHSVVTAVLDHHYAPTDVEATLGVAQSIEDVGLRGAVARGMMGDPTDMARKHNLAGEIFLAVSGSSDANNNARTILSRFALTRALGSSCSLSTLAFAGIGFSAGVILWFHRVVRVNVDRLLGLCRQQSLCGKGDLDRLLRRTVTEQAIAGLLGDAPILARHEVAHEAHRGRDGDVLALHDLGVAGRAAQAAAAAALEQVLAVVELDRPEGDRTLEQLGRVTARAQAALVADLGPRLGPLGARHVLGELG